MVSSNGHLVPLEIDDDESHAVAALAQMERFRKNIDWLQQHANEVFSQHRGKCICVAGQELFVAASPEEAVALGRSSHPEDDAPLVRYIPLENEPRIYANQRRPIHAFRDPATLDICVLGRDITDHFAAIFDRPGNIVCLISQRHRYRIEMF
jgi:hypothetical protein